jgi:hypothetical protein
MPAYIDEPRAIPRDPFNAPNYDFSVPIDHPLLIREEIDKNASGEVVRWRKIYETSSTDSTPRTFQKVIDPGSGDTAVATTVIVYPWVEI